jgi:hypothetical protein
MDAREAIEEIQSLLIPVLESGRQEVAIPALLDYLRTMERDKAAASEVTELQQELTLAHYAAQRENAIAFYRAQHEYTIEMFRSFLRPRRQPSRRAFL